MFCFQTLYCFVFAFYFFDLFVQKKKKRVATLHLECSLVKLLVKIEGKMELNYLRIKIHLLGVVYGLMIQLTKHYV